MSSVDAFDEADASGLNGSAVFFQPRLTAGHDHFSATSTGTLEDNSGLALRSPVADFAVSPNFFGWQGHAKRFLDVTLVLLALLALGPLLVLVAIAILLESRGPVIFSQQREGKDGVPFKALKFRSMNPESCDSSGVTQTVPGDKRVTRIGRVLRKTSIDELPQLFNVLRGDMSLVGPRPHVSRMLAGGMEYRELVPYYDLRLAVRPGITGWAQANGLRGPTSEADRARKRIDHDLAYVQNFSFMLDIKILLLTIRREFVGGTGH